MQTFIKKTLFFIGGITTLSIVFFTLWFNYYSTPSPNLSNSISLNAKVQFLKNNFSIANIDILAIGSSMSLNNINSTSITKTHSNKKYLNLSSWGLSMEETFNLLKIYNKKYHPKTIIISSNYTDFKSSSQRIKYNLINEFLTSKKSIIYNLKFWNFRQAIRESRLLGMYKNDNTIYRSLKFDKNGGVNYPGANFHIDAKRWNGDLNKNKIDIIQYSYLDSITNFCTSNRLNFVFVQSPFREGYYSKIKKEDLTFIKNHIDQVEKILNCTNAIFVNSLNEQWNDNLFVDFSHLNKEGSQVYTEYFLKQIKMNERTTMYKNNSR